MARFEFVRHAFPLKGYIEETAVDEQKLIRNDVSMSERTSTHAERIRTLPFYSIRWVSSSMCDGQAGFWTFCDPNLTFHFGISFIRFRPVQCQLYPVPGSWTQQICD